MIAIVYPNGDFILAAEVRKRFGCPVAYRPHELFEVRGRLIARACGRHKLLRGPFEIVSDSELLDGAKYIVASKDDELGTGADWIPETNRSPVREPVPRADFTTHKELSRELSPRMWEIPRNVGLQTHTKSRRNREITEERLAWLSRHLDEGKIPPARVCQYCWKTASEATAGRERDELLERLFDADPSRFDGVHWVKTSENPESFHVTKTNGGIAAIFEGTYSVIGK